MIKFIKYLGIGLLLSIVGAAQAQQQVTYTQYMFNGMAINPGYIGNHESLSITALGRWQWVGMEGAPKTQTLAIHTPVPNKNIGLGLQITHDQIAISNNTTIQLGYAYKIAMRSGTLSMGLQAGVQSFRANYNEVYTLGQDPSFQEGVSNTKPNFGAGLYYHSDRWFMGVSAPMIMRSNFTNGEINMFQQERHYFLTGGTKIMLNEKFSIMPNVLVKLVEGAPVSADYNLNLMYRDSFWIGVSYRAPESINFLAELKINNNMRIGYAYDHIVDPVLSQVTNSSHEVLLNYRIQWKKKDD